MRLLSILIPTRNRAAWLELLIRTLAREPEASGGDIEIVVSDNASADDTPELIARFQADLPSLPVRLTVQPENLGLVGNLEWLVDAAAGEYVWLLGDDDRPEPGALAEILACLREVRPALLHLPHRFEPMPDGPTTHQSPCPDRLETFSSSRDLLLSYTHWLSFISATVVRRESLRDAIAATRNDNPWAPHIWFALAARDGISAVIPHRLLVGAGEVSWRETYQRYMTTETVASYDDGLRLVLSPADFGEFLDERCRTGGAFEAWDAAPLDELVEVVRRFPTSRLLRKKLAERAHRRSRTDALAVVADAVEASGDTGTAAELVQVGEQRFVEGDAAAAHAAFTAALEIEPTHAEAWCDLGVVRAAQGRFDALLAFDTALELDPCHVGTLVNRAAWALARGYRVRARLDAERVLALDPGSDEARQLLADLS